jgi:hypothetical protein
VEGGVWFGVVLVTHSVDGGQSDREVVSETVIARATTASTLYNGTDMICFEFGVRPDDAGHNNDLK